MSNSAPAIPLFLREDMAIIHAGVTGINFPSVKHSWTSLEGGTVEANSVFTRPGGMQPGFHIGGPSERGDITVKRQFTPDLGPWVATLEDACGTAAAWCSYTLLQRDGSMVVGSLVTISGVLKSLVRTNFDANNSAAAFFGLVIAVNQQSHNN
jgi:hypothetical protein